MLFSTFPFFVFLAVVLVLFYSTPRSWGKWILLAASYYFYMSWNAKFVVLLLTLTAVDYTAALWMERIADRTTQAIFDPGPLRQPGIPRFFQILQFSRR